MIKISLIAGTCIAAKAGAGVFMKVGIKLTQIRYNLVARGVRLRSMARNDPPCSWKISEHWCSPTQRVLTWVGAPSGPTICIPSPQRVSTNYVYGFAAHGGPTYVAWIVAVEVVLKLADVPGVGYHGIVILKKINHVIPNKNLVFCIL